MPFKRMLFTVRGGFATEVAPILRILHKAAKPLTVRAQMRLDHLPPERLRELQWGKLQAVLKAAYDRTPFYRRRFKEIGAVPEDIKSAEDLAKLPVLTRDDLLNHAEEMLTCPREELC